MPERYIAGDPMPACIRTTSRHRCGQFMDECGAVKIVVEQNDASDCAQRFSSPVVTGS